VIAVIFLFLRNIRATIIPAVTVPIALIGALAADLPGRFLAQHPHSAGDRAGNRPRGRRCHRSSGEYRAPPRAGMGPRAAAVLGARQVFFAVLATTATLAAVFIPISFFPGRAGRLFAEFGYVMAFSVGLSMVVALTLTPMMASRMLKDHAGPVPPTRNPILRGIEAIGSRGERLYHRLLDAALAAPLIVLAIAFAFAGAAALVYTTLPEQLTPTEDRGIIPISVSAPQGVSVEYLDSKMREVEAAALPLVDSGIASNVFVLAGMFNANSGFVMVTLKPWEERDRSAGEIAAELNRKLQAIPGVQISARTPNSLGIRGGGQGLQFAITGPEYDPLADTAEQLRVAMEQQPTFENVRLNYNTTQPS
jgi:HAE1 family hydrophobic/amphiphilic exporter-1